MCPVRGPRDALRERLSVQDGRSADAVPGVLGRSAEAAEGHLNREDGEAGEAADEAGDRFQQGGRFPGGDRRLHRQTNNSPPAAATAGAADARVRAGRPGVQRGPEAHAAIRLEHEPAAVLVVLRQRAENAPEAERGPERAGGRGGNGKRSHRDSNGLRDLIK